MTQIKDALLEFNSWWKKEFTIEFNHRTVYDQVQKFLKLPQIIAFTGLRRVGKTTLMLKIVEDQLKNGFDNDNIIYFSFDEFRHIQIRDVITNYEEILEKDIKSGKFLLLLDEIQKLNDWENQLKSIYDLYGKRIKIIISGSESLFIKKKSKETLSGRIFEFSVNTLTFKEFLFFKKIDHQPINLYKKELLKQFNYYIQTQGFPELVEINEKEIINKYIKESIVDKIVFKDIPTLFNIKDITIIESLLNLLMENPGQIIELSKLGKDLNITRQTLANYIKYLEDYFLLRKVYNYSKSARKSERKLKKYYPTIISPYLTFKTDDLTRSKVFEWLLVNQLGARSFWRDSYKNEVDIILTKDKIIPIEIKYGKIDFKSLLTFLNKFKIKTGFIVTWNLEQERTIKDKIIEMIPAYKYLFGYK